jgi:hypothetical protein
MKQLAAAPLDLGYRAIATRLDTDGNLVTWDDVVAIEGEKRTHAGMHRIVGRVISMPGEPWPLLRLDARISRIATGYFKVNHAWVDLGRVDSAVLLSEVWRRPRDGTWTSVYPTGLASVLESVAATQLPGLPPAPIADTDGAVRLQYVNEGSHWLGTGPGQAFLGVVQETADQQLGAARRLDLRPTKMQFVKRVTGSPDADALDTAVEDAGASRLMVHVLPAGSAGRERVRRLLVNQLRLGEDFAPAEGEVVAATERISIVFHPPTPELLETGTPHLPPLSRPGEAEVSVALVETSKALAGEPDDPKPLVRRALADRGIAAQFLDTVAAPPKRDATDHAAISAWRDALRAAGIIDDRLNTAVDLSGRPSLLIGAHLTQPQQARGIAVVLTALVVSESASSMAWRALAYRPGRGWIPYVDAVTDHHGAPLVAEAHRGDRTSTLPTVRNYVDTAIDQLLREHPSHEAVAFMDVDGLARQAWSGLTNKRLGVGPLPGGPPCAERLAVVRLNSTDEVPQPVWHVKSDGAQEMPARLFHGTSDDTWLLVNKSPSLEAFSHTRDGNKTTRFHVADGRSRGRLADNWHALTSTEIVVVRSPGRPAQELAELTARLCHQATSWDHRTTSPVPLHMSKQLYEDHPERR